MRRLRRLQGLIAVVLLAQVVVGYAGYLTPSHEIFPFASWFLFAEVPSRLTDYDLLLHGTEDAPLQSALFLNQASTLVKTNHSVVSHNLIQLLGNAVEAGDQNRCDLLRRQIEEQFIVPAVRYDLVRLDFQPVERWQTGRVRSTRLLRSFVSGQPQSLSNQSAANP